MDAAMDNTAVKTIDLLEARLMRITYVLSGFSDEPDSALLPSQEREAEETVTVRLGRLEHALARLAHKSKVVEDILAWYARHASLLSPDSTHDIPSSLDPEALLAIIMTQATMYPAVSSSLTSILDIPIPPADSSAHLIAHGPKMAELDGSLERQAAEVADLRRRSATACWRWYRTTVLAGGDCWAAWEERVAHLEREIRRLECHAVYDGFSTR